MSTLKAAIPVLPVRAISDAARFYAAKMGFRIAYEDDGYALLARDQIEIHLWAATDTAWEQREGGKPVVSGAETFLAGTASCRVHADDIDALFESFRGADIIHPNGSLADKPYGLREFAVLDMDGNMITFYQNIA